MPEARLEDSGSGLAPASDGWFVVNVGSAGARSQDEWGRYPVSELAARYGASAEEEATNPQQAYARVGEHGKWGRPSCWNRLPWA